MSKLDRIEVFLNWDSHSMHPVDRNIRRKELHDGVVERFKKRWPTVDVTVKDIFEVKSGVLESRIVLHHTSFDTESDRESFSFFEQAASVILSDFIIDSFSDQRLVVKTDTGWEEKKDETKIEEKKDERKMETKEREKTLHFYMELRYEFKESQYKYHYACFSESASMATLRAVKRLTRSIEELIGPESNSYFSIVHVRVLEVSQADHNGKFSNISPEAAMCHLNLYAYNPYEAEGDGE